MDKETLAKAKQLEEDIDAMTRASNYYRNQNWSHWDYRNDRPDTFHFDFCKNYSCNDYDRVNLPRWMNQKLMAVVYQEINRLQQELDTLGYEKEIIANVCEPGMTDKGGETEVDTPVLTAPCTADSKSRWADRFLRTMDRLINWTIYSLVFCFLIGIVGVTLSTREVVGYSLMLGFFAGSINNIERVLRELFGKIKED